MVKELLRSDENEKLASILEDVEKLTGDELDDALSAEVQRAHTEEAINFYE